MSRPRRKPKSSLRRAWLKDCRLRSTGRAWSSATRRTGDVLRFQIFYHLVEFLSGRRTFGFFPAFGATRLDIVPVDYVANAVVWSSGTQETVGTILHLCAGPEESLTLDELQSRVRTSFVAAGVRVPMPITVPPAILRVGLPVIRALLPEPGRRALSTLPIFLAYLSGNQSFANDKTRTILGDAGIVLPAVDSYLARCWTGTFAPKPKSHEGNRPAAAVGNGPVPRIARERSHVYDLSPTMQRSVTYG